MFKTPIALIAFNRPDVTKQTFKQIKKKKPEKLFLIVDGPREGNFQDLKNNEKVKKIISNIDWKCKVYKNFSKKNLGLKKRIVSGLNWVFKNVDRAIILEDDCYATNNFFIFCEKLLNLYKSNKKIHVITGNNFQAGPVNNNSYYFSKYSHIWGWATWRRTWKLYDDDDKKIKKFLNSRKFKKVCGISGEQKYWRNMYSQIKSGDLKSWAFYFLINIWDKEGITITPNLNLVKNLGINKKSFSNLNENYLQINISKKTLKFPLIHPKKLKVDEKADNWVFYNIYKRSLLIRLKNKIKKILKIDI